ncbi:MAG TPA: trypsin-like peptidase domain-containing protein [Planctomycetaceae bacterium]|nr:trypsin-like peptidase domain-containing protein [Planctomycetaceae bacterium]
MKVRSTSVWCGVLVLLGGWFAFEALQADPNARRSADAELDGTSNALRDAGRVMAKIAKQISPSVVHIESLHRTALRGEVEETGSGVIFRGAHIPGEYVVTNRHVIAGAKLTEISITLVDGRLIHPEKTWEDEASDIAVLKVTVDGLTAASWGDSDAAEIGHPVLAVGSPFGLSQSVTFGIISAKSRRSLKLGDRGVLNQDFLQTDAAINPGNSGGPLIDLTGHVVGINTAIASNSGGNEGIGFSIPSNLVSRVVDQLLEYGKVYRAYLGVKLDPEFNASKAKTLKLDRVRGARVMSIYPNTPAARAKLIKDDVILSFDGVDILDENHLINVVSLSPVGKRVRLTVLRKGEKLTVYVDLSDRSVAEEEPAPAAPQQSKTNEKVELMGLSVCPLDAQLAPQLGLNPSATGVLIIRQRRLPNRLLSNQPAAAASESELRPGDIIERFAGFPIHTAEELEQLASQVPEGGRALIEVVRKHPDRPIHREWIVWQRPVGPAT